MKKKVLVIGELNVDLILNQIDGFPKIGTEILSSELNLTLGSSSAIFASNLSAQGQEVFFLGMVGTDQFGALVQDCLKENNVDTNLIIESTVHKTGVTVVMNYNMDRAMITYPGAMDHLSINEVKKIDMTKFDHVHISSIFLQPLIKRDIISILKICKEYGISTSLDPQWDPSEKWDIDLENILPLVDVFLPNEKEFLALTNSKDLQNGVQTLNGNHNLIAIKEGEKGSTLFFKNKPPISKKAYLNENVVDCIGAGDSFDSGFIHSFIHNQSYEECLERGNIMGAANTTHSGGTSAFKNLEETKRLVKKMFNYTFK